MTLRRSIKNQKDFFFHWKIVVPLLLIYMWFFEFKLIAFLVISPVIFGLDLLPGLYLIYSFKKQSPFARIDVNRDNISFYDDSDTLVNVINADNIEKMIGYKPGSHPSYNSWSPFSACWFAFQHVEIELNDGRILNITSLYDENIDATIKTIKPEVYEEKMGVPYIRRRNTFP